MFAEGMRGSGEKYSVLRVESVSCRRVWGNGSDRTWTRDTPRDVNMTIDHLHLMALSGRFIGSAQRLSLSLKSLSKSSNVTLNSAANSPTRKAVEIKRNRSPSRTHDIQLAPRISSTTSGRTYPHRTACKARPPQQPPAGVRRRSFRWAVLC